MQIEVYIAHLARANRLWSEHVFASSKQNAKSVKFPGESVKIPDESVKPES